MLYLILFENILVLKLLLINLSSFFFAFDSDMGGDSGSLTFDFNFDDEVHLIDNPRSQTHPSQRNIILLKSSHVRMRDNILYYNLNVNIIIYWCYNKTVLTV